MTPDRRRRGHERRRPHLGGAPLSRFTVPRRPAARHPSGCRFAAPERRSQACPCRSPAAARARSRLSPGRPCGVGGTRPYVGAPILLARLLEAVGRRAGAGHPRPSTTSGRNRPSSAGGSALAGIRPGTRRSHPHRLRVWPKGPMRNAVMTLFGCSPLTPSENSACYGSPVVLVSLIGRFIPFVHC